MTHRLLYLLVVLWLALALCPAHTLAQPADEPAREPSLWSLRLSAELGAGSRDIDLPMDGFVHRIRPGFFPTAGLGFELDHAASDAMTLGLIVRYQSSIAHGIVEQHTDGSVHPLDVRAHRLELGFAPRIRLDASGVFSLLGALGYGFSNFRPEAHHLVTPAYSLIGPYLRAGLQLAPWPERLRLIVAPELQWVHHVGPGIRERGVAAQGLAAGGEAAIELVLSAHWSVRAGYRETRCWLDSSQEQRFQDVARFITARVAGAL
jgi:hypothetical protein